MRRQHDHVRRRVPARRGRRMPNRVWPPPSAGRCAAVCLCAACIVPCSAFLVQGEERINGSHCLGISAMIAFECSRKSRSTSRVRFFGLENGVTTPELPSVEGRWTVATTVATLRRYQCVQVKGALSPMILTPLATKAKQVFADGTKYIRTACIPWLLNVAASAPILREGTAASITIGPSSV